MHTNTKQYKILGVYIHSVCLKCILLTFELTGDICALLLVGMAYAFGTVGHVQPSVRRMAKHTLKEFQEVIEVFNISLNPRMWSLLNKSILWFASWCFILINLAVEFKMYWLHFGSLSLLYTCSYVSSHIIYYSCSY